MVKTSCGFVIKNIDGKILIAHPTNDFAGEGIWVLPKGEMEDGEDEFGCAYREVFEETNLDLKNIKGKITPIESFSDTKIMFLFEAEEDLSVYKIKCNSLVELYSGFEPFYEMDGFKWVSVKNSLKYLSEREQKLVNKSLLS